MPRVKLDSDSPPAPQKDPWDENEKQQLLLKKKKNDHVQICIAEKIFTINYVL